MTFNGTGNVVDGTINNWAEDGEPRQDLPEDAVEEFKVTNAGYKAEFGLATGGVVQVVTKSGTNGFHGTAFEYFRNKSLNARGVFESREAGVSAATSSAAASADRSSATSVHFFGAVERTDTDEFYTVRTGQPQFYSSLEGTFPLPSTRNLYFGARRLAVHQRHSRSSPATSARTKEDVPGLRRHRRASGRDEEMPRQRSVVGHTWLRGARQLNDFRFQYAHAAFYGYPGRHRIWKDTGAFPAGARQRGRPASTAFRR